MHSVNTKYLKFPFLGNIWPTCRPFLSAFELIDKCASRAIWGRLIAKGMAWTSVKSAFGFVGTSQLVSGILYSSWLTLDSKHATKKRYGYFLFRLTPRTVPRHRQCSCGRDRKTFILHCCHSRTIRTPQFIHWSSVNSQQRRDFAQETKQPTTASCFLPALCLLCESTLVVFLLKRKLVSFYSLVLAQVFWCAIGVYFRTKIPKKVDEFDKILEAAISSNSRLAVMEPILSASQSARQSMSFITNSAREWFRGGNETASVSQTQEIHDKEKSIDDSIYASSREEWENEEEELFGDESDSVDSVVVESPTNEPTVVRKQGSVYSMVFSTSKSASQTHQVDSKDSSAHTYGDTEQECENSMQPVSSSASVATSMLDDEKMVISPPNIWQCIGSILGFFSIVARHVVAMFQVLIMILRDIWFRSNPKFKTRTSFYPAIVSNKDSVLSFNRSWSKIANHFGYFPEYEYAHEESSDSRSTEMDTSTKDSFASFVQDIWKGKNISFNFWKNVVSKTFQDGS